MTPNLRTRLFTLLVLCLSVNSQAFTPKIGVMVWSKDINTAPIGAVDKLCILQTLTERTGVEFQLYENQKMLIGSAKVAEDMVNDHIDLAILPGWSDQTLKAVPTLTAANIPYLTSATSDAVVTSPNNGLSIFARNQAQAETMVQFYLENYSDRPLDVVTDVSSTYSRQLSAQFIAALSLANANISVTEHEIVDVTSNNLPNLSGHVVFAALYNPDIALLYREMHFDGDVILLSTDAVGGHNRFLDIAGRNILTNGSKIIFLRTWDSQLHGDRADDFRSVFNEHCSKIIKEPTFGSVRMYELASLAIDWAHSDGKQTALESVQHSQRQSIIDGHRFEFTKSGYRKPVFYFYEFTGGKHAVRLR